MKKKVQLGIYAALIISIVFNIVVLYQGYGEFGSKQEVQAVTPAELAFLAKYRVPLVEEVQVNDTKKLPQYLRQAIESSYIENGQDLTSYSLSENSTRIAHAILRVNGSIPVYKVRGAYASNVKDALLWTSGNCSDYSLRLMLVLESMGLKTAMISNVTKALPGHVIVDAYDSDTDTAYLLDANFNVMIEMPESGGNSFVETLFKLDEKARKELADSIRISTLPVYFNFSDPGTQAYASNAVTVEILNSHRSSREKTWRNWLANDVDELRQWWLKAPGHAPNTLSDIRQKGLSAIPDVFDHSGGYAQNIKIAAGITN